MKIYTITCHDLYNHGATLQAYALMKYLENCGHNVEIIDYRPTYHAQVLDYRFDVFWVPEKWRRSMFHKFIYRATKFPSRYLKISKSCKRAFIQFNRKYLKLTPIRYSSSKKLKTELPPADYYIAGSDQIWNTYKQNGRDPAYYLDFVPDSAGRISYAASLSSTQVHPKYKEFVQRMVKAIHHVSVREETGVGILKGLGINNATRVLDPVFLMDRCFWDDLSDMDVRAGYILVYAFQEDAAVAAFAQKLAKASNLKIYAVNNYQKTPYADVDYYHIGPKGFLSLVKNAEVVVGNSLHALAFSLIFEKEFYVFRRQGRDINSRLHDLLKIVGLRDRMDPDLSCARSVGANAIPYDSVTEVLQAETFRSKRFLQDALSGNYN